LLHLRHPRRPDPEPVESPFPLLPRLAAPDPVATVEPLPSHTRTGARATTGATTRARTRATTGATPVPVPEPLPEPLPVPVPEPLPVRLLCTSRTLEPLSVARRRHCLLHWVCFVDLYHFAALPCLSLKFPATKSLNFSLFCCTVCRVRVQLV